MDELKEDYQSKGKIIGSKREKNSGLYGKIIGSNTPLP